MEIYLFNEDSRRCMSDSDSSFDSSRRAVLKGVTSSGAVVGGAAVASGSVAAKKARRYGTKFSRPSVARSGFEQHTGELREELASRGILESDTVDQFDFESTISSQREAVVDGNEGFKTTGVVEEDDPTAHLVVTKQTDEYAVTVHVQPHRGWSYAFVENPTTEERFVVDTDTEGVKLTESEECRDDRYSRCTERCCNDDANSDNTIPHIRRCVYDGALDTCECYWEDLPCEQGKCTTSVCQTEKPW